MEKTRAASSAAVGGGVALAFAITAGVALTSAAAIWSARDSSEAAVAILTIVGWMLLAWAVITGAAVAAHLVRAGFARRRPASAEIVLVLAASAAIALVVVMHPPFGSGGGAG